MFDQINIVLLQIPSSGLKEAMTSSTYSSLPASSTLMALSKEDRQSALAKTDLIARYRPGWWGTGLLIQDGQPTSQAPLKCDHGPASCDCYSFPHSLLVASNPLSEDAREVMLRENRLVFSGPPRKSLEWLKAQGQSVKEVRRMDCQFASSEVREWSQLRGEWEELIEFVVDNLDVPELEFSLDAGGAFETYQEQRLEESDLEYVREAYEAIVRTVVERLGGRKMKKFEVFWACFFGMEKEAERMVMGEEYDAEKEGKVPASRRNPWFPHGVPEERLEWEDGMEL